MKKKQQPANHASMLLVPFECDSKVKQKTFHRLNERIVFALYFQFPTFQMVQTVDLATKTKKQANVVFTLLFCFFGLTKAQLNCFLKIETKPVVCYLRTSLF